MQSKSSIWAAGASRQPAYSHRGESTALQPLPTAPAAVAGSSSQDGALKPVPPPQAAADSKNARGAARVSQKPHPGGADEASAASQAVSQRPACSAHTSPPVTATVRAAAPASTVAPESKAARWAARASQKQVEVEVGQGVSELASVSARAAVGAEGATRCQPRDEATSPNAPDSPAGWARGRAYTHDLSQRERPACRLDHTFMVVCLDGVSAVAPSNCG